MNFSSRLIAGVLLLFAPVAPSQDRRGTVRIVDRGMTRDFIVATNELHVGKARRIEEIPPQPDAEHARSYAEAISFLRGDDADLVLYPAGASQDESNRRLLTKQILVRLTPDADANAVAAQAGATISRVFNFLPHHVLLETRGAGSALTVAERLRRIPGVISADPQLARQARKKFVPDDTYFTSQWHLLNIGQGGGTSGMDVNVTNVWNTFRGSNVVIGIVDDGLQLTHPDLASNVNTAIDWDFDDDDNDPSPNLSRDYHGTSVAGVAAARGNNGQGVSGAAPDATLVGLRLIARVTTDAEDASALSHSNALIHIKNNSWGADDCPSFGAVLEGAGPLARAAIRDGVVNGRNGKGVIYVWAGGNGRGCAEDVNYDAYANIADVFAVGALSDIGQQADYSEPGACLVVVTPSSSAGRQEIVTTDLVGDNGENFSGAFDLSNRSYTRTFTGTSSATPLASGVIALVLQANPALSYRDVKEILLRSSTKVQPGDSDWRTNAAGIPHNHRFGAGLINAGAAVSLATNWSLLGVETNVTVLLTNLNRSIPDNNAGGVTNLFAITNVGFRVEAATLTMTAPHGKWGDLSVTLTSPSGTQSRLAERHSSADTSYNYEAWTFSTVRHWGEHASGDWMVKVADTAATRTGTLNALELTVYGSVPVAKLSIEATNADAQLTLRAPAVGWQYEIQTVVNLRSGRISWFTLGTVTIPPGGVATFTDTNVLGFSRRFYRARLLP